MGGPASPQPNRMPLAPRPRAISKDNFIEVSSSYKNIDRYVIRKAVLAALKDASQYFHGRLLDAGCGKMPYREFILRTTDVEQYIGLDIENARVYDRTIRPDFTWDGRTMPFAHGSFDCCIATEVLEHCPEPEFFMKEVYRVLKPGGIFFFTVPFLWNLHEVPNDEYRYTPFALTRHLRNSGFADIDIRPTGGWHAAMAQMMGLWARRSGLGRIRRIWLSLLFVPVMRLLLRMDEKEDWQFVEGTMITGLHGTAKR